MASAVLVSLISYYRVIISAELIPARDIALVYFLYLLVAEIFNSVFKTAYEHERVRTDSSHFKLNALFISVSDGVVAHFISEDDVKRAVNERLIIVCGRALENYHRGCLFTVNSENGRGNSLAQRKICKASAHFRVIFFGENKAVFLVIFCSAAAADAGEKCGKHECKGYKFFHFFLLISLFVVTFVNDIKFTVVQGT